MALALLLAASMPAAKAHAACDGDINGNGAVDISDALSTLRYVVNLIPHDAANEAKYKSAVDVFPLDANNMPQGDGNINISDALYILRRVVNLLTWPIEGATITDQPGPIITMEPAALGDVTFSVDDARTGSMSYAADGQPASLAVTDASGLVWRLDLPGDALLQPAAIRLTALRDLDSVTLPGAISGGVLLEPDGLHFLNPATLTVTPPEGNTVGLILMGRHDGTGVEIAPTTVEQGSVSARIFHFSTSTSTSSDDPAMDKLRQGALADFQSARTAAQEILKQGLTVPPPPDAKLHCLGTSAYQDPEAAIAEYEEKVNYPEEDVRNRLIGVAKALALLGEQATSDEALKLAQDVQARVVKKTGTLVKTYTPQPDKFIAVSRVALNAERSNQLLGGADDGSTMTTLATWAGTFMDHYIDELKERHDYRVMPALYEAARIAALLGAANAGDAAIERILAAQTFTAYFDTNLVLQGDRNLIFHVNGNVTIDKTAEETEAWEGTDNGKYVGFSSSNPDITGMVMPNAFPVTVKILKIDACEENKAVLTVSAIGADSEVLISTNGPAPVPYGLVKTNAYGLLYENLDPDSAYTIFKFSMPLTNLDQEAAREIFTNAYGGASIQYDLKLHHDPK
jgi:hypothetical protein